MEIPTGDATALHWPPAHTRKVATTMTEWAAWWAGDTTALATAYRGTSARPRPSGGILGAAARIIPQTARWFWGTPTPTGQQPRKLHVPIAADLAAASADLLFSEPLTLDTAALDAGTGTQASSDRLTAILEANGWEALLLEAAELCAALGGVFLRVTWDDAIADMPLLTVVHADGALPEFAYGRLRAVTFWHVLDPDPARTVRHLERHTPGRIEHALFIGTQDRLGRRVPLDEHPDTAPVADIVDGLSGIPTGLDVLTVAYAPNLRPQRRWRADPYGAPLGRSDLDGIEPLLDAYDEVWSSWMRDIRLGKARLLVPRNQLEVNGPGQGADYNLEREVVVELAPVAGSARDAGVNVTAQQFAIRVTEHEATCRALLARIITDAGYSLQTFGETGDVAVTATEVTARERRSLTTRGKKIRYWRAALADILSVLLAVDREVFGHTEHPPGARVPVEFPATVQPSIRETAETLQLLRSAQAASTRTRIALVHPDWDDTQVDAEAALVLAEEGMAVPDIGPVPLLDDYTPGPNIDGQDIDGQGDTGE